MKELDRRAKRLCCVLALLAIILTSSAQLVGDDPIERKAVWYRFDSAEDLARSSGVNPWPAYAFRAYAGEGNWGGGLALKGEADNGLMLPNPAAFFGETARAGTIALWVKPDFDSAQEKGQRVVIDFMKETRNTLIDGYEIAILTDRDRLAAQAAISERMYVPTPLARDRWTHIALAWSAEAGSTLYVNGELVAQMKRRFKPTPLSEWPGRVGSHTPSGGYPFVGAIDELQIFDQMLTDDEVKELAQGTPQTPKLKVSGWNSENLEATNLGARPVAVWLRGWLPDRGDASTWGYLPLPEHEFGSQPVYVGGASGVISKASSPTRLAPGQTVALPPPKDSDDLGWRRIGVMVNEGLECHETSVKDFVGIVCEATPTALFGQRNRVSSRNSVSNEHAKIKLTVRNDTGHRYAGSLTGRLFRDSGQYVSALPKLNVALNHGETTAFDVQLADRALPVGSYRLQLNASTESGGGFRLREIKIRVTEDVEYKSMFGVGAAYVAHPPSPKLLQKMADDGVRVLRRSAGSWWSEGGQIHPFGFKMWYTAAFSSRSICANPKVLARTERLASQLGACFRNKPEVLNQVMLGEGLSRPPCYCELCNNSFRSYLKDKYGDILRLNARWGSRYERFDDVNQMGGPEDVDHAAERMRLMKRELPKGRRERQRELFRLDPTRAMEWQRWHDGFLMDWYDLFARSFKKANASKTALSEQPCWPNFRHHVLFHLGKVADLGGMDLYLPGELPATLGYASELFLNFDMNASIFHGKPLWLHELYVQDNSPEGLAEAQGWFLVGRGYRMLTYFTYDYYHEGTRGGMPLIFGMFDKEWKPYPCYESFARFSRQLAKFHSEYNALSLRREEPRVALFLGDDISLANWLETGGETWNAAGVHGHVGAYWLTERNGCPVEFVNDDGLSKLDGKSALIVPWTHVIEQRTLANILDFARAGGTVIFDGPIGLYDENYRVCSPLPGGPAMEELGVRYIEYQDKPNELVVEKKHAAIRVEPGTKISTSGIPIGVTVTEGEVLARDTDGNPALIHERLGEGQVFMFLTNLGRNQRSRNPDPNALALWRGILECAGVVSHHVMTRRRGAGSKPADADLDHKGAGLRRGDALCDVSLRLRGDNELFVFMVSFFNSTDGEVVLTLASGDYEAEDAMSHEAVTLRKVDGGYSLPIQLPPFGTQVVRVRCTNGPLKLGAARSRESH